RRPELHPAPRAAHERVGMADAVDRPASSHAVCSSVRVGVATVLALEPENLQRTSVVEGQRV
ncbi:hypothetical protein PUR59_00725, partial [Streptomyces sp. SP18ES09]|nr:hypothetical protein [Streptomyces sp. SP18ES09]